MWADRGTAAENLSRRGVEQVRPDGEEAAVSVRSHDGVRPATQASQREADEARRQAEWERAELLEQLESEMRVRHLATNAAKAWPTAIRFRGPSDRGGNLPHGEGHSLPRQYDPLILQGTVQAAASR